MSWDEWVDYKADVRRGEHTPSDPETAQLRALYDGRLAYVDEELGRFM